MNVEASAQVFGRIAALGDALRVDTRTLLERLTLLAPEVSEYAMITVPHTFDRIFLVHMYHEVASPYAFLWHLREGLKPDGLVVVVDADRPVKRHGMPPEQLKCEFAALNLKPEAFNMLAGGEVYFSAFRVAGPRPQPGAIKPCDS